MGTTVKLVLRTRPTSDDTMLTMPIAAVKALVDGDRKDDLMSYFKAIRDIKSTVHDREWLKLIANYIPIVETQQGRQQKLIPLTDQAPWLFLAKRISDLVEKDGGVFTLSKTQADLIWKRLSSADFQPGNFAIPFQAFVLDFMQAYGKKFDAMTEDLEFDEPVPQEPAEKTKNPMTDEKQD